MHYKGDCIRIVDSKTPVLGEHRLLTRERNFLNDWNNLRCWKTMKNQITNFMSRKRAIIASDSGGKVRISLNWYRFELNTLELDAGSNASQGRTVPLEGLWFFLFFLPLTQHRWVSEPEGHLKPRHACAALSWLYLCCIPMNPACTDLTHKEEFSKKIMMSVSLWIHQEAHSMYLFTYLLPCFLMLSQSS